MLKIRHAKRPMPRILTGEAVHSPWEPAAATLLQMPLASASGWAGFSPYTIYLYETNCAVMSDQPIHQGF